MIERWKVWAHAWLVALDQLTFVWLAGFKYVLRDGEPPSAQETVSSKCGRMAAKGKRWAIVAAFLIDHLFMLIGSKPGHCARMIVRADWLRLVTRTG